MYSKEYVLSIEPKHKQPGSAMEWTGYWTVTAMRRSFDLVTGYKPDKWMSAPRWLTRILFLETVAGVRPPQHQALLTCKFYPDFLTGYKADKWVSALRWLTRILFVETVAGVRPPKP